MDECTGCTLHDRRTFVVRALSALASVSLLSPLRAHASGAPPVSFVSGIADRDGMVRYPIPAADGATIDSENEVIIVRTRGTCIAFALSCPHQRAMLRIKSGDTAFQCPKHKSEYRSDGTFIRGRATRNMDRLTIAKQGSELVVDVDSQIQSDDAPAAWAAAIVTL
jgi:nitrite reductase/ring-hydroxylating ferredoxin subunit